MDPTTFDQLSRLFAARRPPRRQVLRAIGASLAGGLLGLAGSESEPAAAFICRNEGVLCAKDAHCCSGSCVNHHCATSSFCPAGGDACFVSTLCHGGTCSCASDVDGSNVCFHADYCRPPCTSDADCEKQMGVTGVACVVSLCCEGPTNCVFRC